MKELLSLAMVDLTKGFSFARGGVGRSSIASVQKAMKGGGIVVDDILRNESSQLPFGYHYVVFHATYVEANNVLRIEADMSRTAWAEGLGESGVLCGLAATVGPIGDGILKEIHTDAFTKGLMTDDVDEWFMCTGFSAQAERPFIIADTKTIYFNNRDLSSLLVAAVFEGLYAEEFANKKNNDTSRIGPLVLHPQMGGMLGGGASSNGLPGIGLYLEYQRPVLLNGSDSQSHRRRVEMTVQQEINVQISKTAAAEMELENGSVIGIPVRCVRVGQTLATEEINDMLMAALDAAQAPRAQAMPPSKPNPQAMPGFGMTALADTGSLTK